MNQYTPFKNELEKINFLWSEHTKPKYNLTLTQEQLDLLKNKYPDFLIAYKQIFPRIIENFGKEVYKKVI